MQNVKAKANVDIEEKTIKKLPEDVRQKNRGLGPETDGESEQ